MKKLLLFLGLVLIILPSCKKETKDPTPVPAGSCYCGEILQTDMNNKTVTARNYCSGTILTFYVGSTWFTTIHPDYCQTVSW